ncbi:MAG: BMP family ABC transporter substrate-binding protein [Syntrophobacteraceae bacterium]|nr:BMP family ABC transporter substrate-binding protein [Syntrophobacteraceae bacterium]MCU0589364.1 BMP family ABC transporter substrate-binding protein [Syntrophobacteraceae bacterium]
MRRRGAPRVKVPGGGMRIPGAVMGMAFCLMTHWIAVCGAAPLKVVVLTDAAGLGDKGFNDVCWSGVQRARADFGIEAHFIQSREQADYAANIQLAARHGDVIVTLGYLFEDALRRVVPSHPRKRFIHIEGVVVGDNIACYDFRSEEGGFLAGLVAGLHTRARKVAVVAGMEIPPVEAYVSGFRAGIRTAELHRGDAIQVIVVFAGSFNDPVKGKSLAQAAIDQGADVIFRAAGNTGVGVLEAVKGAGNVALIAEDLDQDDEIPGRVLTSTLKRMDVAVYEAMRSIVEDRFRAGHRWLGAADGAMDITEMKHSRALFDAADLQRIQKARELLKKGALKVPARSGDVDGFQPPRLDS